MSEAEGDRIEILVNVEGFQAAPVALVESGVRAVLDEAGVTNAEISVTLLDDESIRALNEQYLGRDRPTDVIAFTLGDEDRVLGDVYLGVEQAARQAAELGERHDHELVRLAIHGTLHVLGHDHPEGAQRLESPMFVLQERLVSQVLGGA